jgi:methylmalonyl-CoA mutase cobalamin-binding subunit
MRTANDTDFNVDVEGTMTGETDVVAAGVSGKGHQAVRSPIRRRVKRVFSGVRDATMAS